MLNSELKLKKPELMMVMEPMMIEPKMIEPMMMEPMCLTSEEHLLMMKLTSLYKIGSGVVLAPYRWRRIFHNYRKT